MADQSAAGATPTEGRILGEQGRAMIEQAAVALGINCTNCGLPMEGPGFEFVSLRAVFKVGDRPKVINSHVFLCGRDDCAKARDKAYAVATAVRPAGGWQVFEAKAAGEEDGVDEPSAS